MDVTSTIGDVLSYSRLLALALATGGIALTVNILTQMMLAVPFVGTILAALVFLAGHLFNLVMNMLGSFIHSLRLHYVEFFGKFYESGGEPFNPFKVDYDNIELR